MKIEHRQDFLSISKFDPIETSDFVVLTGLNGAGKSHFLLAIVNGAIKVDEIDHLTSIAYFNNGSFYIENEAETNVVSLVAERSAIFEAIKSQSVMNNSKSLRESLIPKWYSQIVELAGSLSKPFYELAENDFNGLGNEAFIRYREYKQGVIDYIRSRPDRVNDILELTKNVRRSLSEITLTDVQDYYSPHKSKSNVLITDLTKLFVNYYEKWETNKYHAFLNSGALEPKYSVYSEQEFRLKYGEPPWDVLNSLLARFGSLKYAATIPEGLERSRVYKLELIDKQSGIRIQFNDLSSGERTMMALVSALYKTTIPGTFPKLLLLDEIDSALHPSMIRNLIDVVNGTLVGEKRVKAILVTHSPTTVALAPPESIYLMIRGGRPLLNKIDNADALSILTEGFASLSYRESSLRINYNIRKSSHKTIILTEGVTDRLILETAWYKLFSKEPPFEIQECFDAGYLKILLKRGEIFREYKSKVFVALFDFDGAGYECWSDLTNFNIIENNPHNGLLKKHTTENGFAMLLPVPRMTYNTHNFPSNESLYLRSQMPIELLFYGIQGLDSYFEMVEDKGMKVIRFKARKIQFAEEIIPNLDKSAFANFLPIFDHLSNAIGTGTIN